MNKKRALAGYRIFFALLGLSAIVTEIATIIERGRFVPSNFFSFFTIESNLFAVTILLISAFALVHSNKQSRLLAMLRGANTMYMIVVGVVFSLLLSGLDAELTAVPWDNIVLHYIIPIAVALDWLMDTPKVRITFKHALVWMAFPIIYVVFSLIRGHFVGWYPYPFLNPTEGGYASVAVVSALIALGGLILAYILAWSTGRQSAAKN